KREQGAGSREQGAGRRRQINSQRSTGALMCAGKPAARHLPVNGQCTAASAVSAEPRLQPRTTTDVININEQPPGDARGQTRGSARARKRAVHWRITGAHAVPPLTN